MVEFAGGVRLAIPPERREALDAHVGRELVFGVRPEHMNVAREGDSRRDLARLTVGIDLIQPTGSRTYATFHLGDTAVVAELQAHDIERPGETLTLHVDMNRAVLVDPANDLVI